jgi:mRNA interferase RelE/StbE
MKFNVEIHKRVLKDLKDLPKSNLEKFKELIETLKTNPIPKEKFDIKRLKGSDDVYRVRIGKFRVQYVVLWEDKIVVIRKVSRREGTYKSP